MNIKKFEIQIKSIGAPIMECDTYEEAVFEVMEMELEDVRNEEYERDYYDIVEVTTSGQLI